MTQRVAITKVDGDDIEAAVRQAVTLAGGLGETIKKDSKVLIKPNVCQPVASGTGIITNARVTEVVTRMVLELGPKSVIIGEGAAAGYDFAGFNISTEETFRVSGTADVARRLGVELRDLNRDAFEEVTIPHPCVMDKVRIARTAVDSDVIISVPVLKSHVRTQVTVSLKNMKGVMSGAEKRKSHRLGLDLAIVDLNSVVRPSYAVVDATVAMEGLWQYPQDCRELGLVLAGRDPLAVDMVGASLIGVDPKKVMHLRYLSEQDGAVADLNEIEIVGESLEKHRRQFKSGFQAFEERYPSVHIIQGDSACTGCTSELVSVLHHIKEAGYGQIMENLTIILGNPTEPRVTGKTAVLGKCADEFSHLGSYTAGCPPKEDSMIQAICEVCGADAARVMTMRDEVRRQQWESSNALPEQ